MTPASDLAASLLALERASSGRFALCVGSGGEVERLSGLLPPSERDVFWADGGVLRPPPGRHHPFTSADTYEGELRAYFGACPRFDAVVLEPGADGAVGPIRLGSVEALEDERWAIVAADGRFTLTLPVLRAARRLVLLGRPSPLLPGAEVVSPSATRR